MTNQLNIAHQNSNLNWRRFWLFSKVFLSVLIVGTGISSLKVVPSVFVIFNIAIGVIFIGIILWIRFRRKKTTFIHIEGNKLQYFCPVKKELIVIPINEITSIRTHFCELEIHTDYRTYCLNLNHIKQEKQRWEIKEMVRNLTVENGKRAVNF